MILFSKKLVAKRIQLGKSSVSTSIQKDMKKLGKICHRCTERVGQVISKEERWQFNTEIDKINRSYELQIDKINETY